MGKVPSKSAARRGSGWQNWQRFKICPWGTRRGGRERPCYLGTGQRLHTVTLPKLAVNCSARNPGTLSQTNEGGTLRAGIFVFLIKPVLPGLVATEPLGKSSKGKNSRGPCFGEIDTVPCGVTRPPISSDPRKRKGISTRQTGTLDGNKCDFMT